ncbi:unnamed protein product [Rotaria sp. Silwood2]|nr:unnamed protein product [Rotaria sp. Silwood2]
MTLSITYKQQCKVVIAVSNQFYSTNSLNNDECRIYFQKLVHMFNIENKSPETILLEYPNAKLRELSIDNNEDEDLVVILLHRDGYFSCKLHKKYELYTEKHGAVRSTLNEEQYHFSNIDIEMAAILSDAVYYTNPIAHINEKY